MVEAWQKIAISSLQLPKILKKNIWKLLGVMDMNLTTRDQLPQWKRDPVNLFRSKISKIYFLSVMEFLVFTQDFT